MAGSCMHLWMKVVLVLKPLSLFLLIGCFCMLAASFFICSLLAVTDVLFKQVGNTHHLLCCAYVSAVGSLQ